MTPIALACAGIALAAVLVNFVFVMTRISNMPDRVPVHFNIMGRPDRWAGKNFSWMYPIASFLLLAAIASIISNILRRPGSIDSMAMDVELTSMIGAFVSLMMLAITLLMVAVARKKRQGLGRGFIPAVLVGVLLIILRHHDQVH